MRERGNIWPVISVAAGAFFVLVIMPLILHRQKSSEMATAPRSTVASVACTCATTRSISSSVRGTTTLASEAIRSLTPRQWGRAT